MTAGTTVISKRSVHGAVDAIIGAILSASKILITRGVLVCSQYSAIVFDPSGTFHSIRLCSDWVADQAGFDTISVACQIGRVYPEARGVTELEGFLGATCNPIAQAEIFNSEDTQLNFILGLCLGHDILFTRYSQAPVSTLIVKDRVTGHNPAAVLYTFHHRRHLWKLYCDKDI